MAGDYDSPNLVHGPAEDNAVVRRYGNLYSWRPMFCHVSKRTSLHCSRSFFVQRLLLLVVVTAACSDKNGDQYSRSVLASWGEHIIMPHYRDFEEKAAALQTQGNALCQNPSTDALDAARQAWSAARAPWKQMEVFAFGPYKEEPLRLGPKIDFWPVRLEAIEQILFDTLAIDADALGAPSKGMAVAEYLLYQPDVDVVAEFAAVTRRCEYFLAVVGDLALRATAMRQAWDPDDANYVAELVEPGNGPSGADSAFDNRHEALSEVVNRMAFTVENIRADKLGRPLGTSSGGSPQPNKAESQFSGRSIEDIRDNLRGIELLYFGTGMADSVGLDFYAQKRGHDFAPAMRDSLSAAREALGQIPEPLTEAVVTAPIPVSAAIERLGDLQRLIQVDILNALSLTPRFNDNDGD